MHLVSDSQRLSFSQELTPNLKQALSLGLGLPLARGHNQDKRIWILTSFEDICLEVFEDTHLLHLVSDSKRLSFSQELTPTLNLGLSLTLAWGHFQDIKFFIYTSFKDFSLNVYDDTNLLHLVSDSQRLSFFLGVNPNLNPRIKLRVRIRVSLG